MDVLAAIIGFLILLTFLDILRRINSNLSGIRKNLEAIKGSLDILIEGKWKS